MANDKKKLTTVSIIIIALIFIGVGLFFIFRNRIQAASIISGGKINNQYILVIGGASQKQAMVAINANCGQQPALYSREVNLAGSQYTLLLSSRDLSSINTQLNSLRKTYSTCSLTIKSSSTDSALTCPSLTPIAYNTNAPTYRLNFKTCLSQGGDPSTWTSGTNTGSVTLPTGSTTLPTTNDTTNTNQTCPQATCPPSNVWFNCMPCLTSGNAEKDKICQDQTKYCSWLRSNCPNAKIAS